ncbi:MAG: NfeD family protein [Akkermansiaceae bacterium]|nr:NfeD family protein [Akkermansiaceae bacterium]
MLALAALSPVAPGQEAAEATDAKKKVYVIPVREGIFKPALYVVRRGLKEAITEKADVVVLDMETPGGRLDVTFDILKAIEKFPGDTITYVNREATSAGAIIAAGTDQIWLHPKATIGSAEPVSSTGEDINESMQRKILSYLKAKIRAMTEEHRYRSDVIAAMMDPNEELVIDEKVISPKDDLLNLTASEAVETFGDPPVPLLGAGKAESIDQLLDSVLGEGNYTVKRIETSWSEDLAQFITALTPALLAFGLLGLFIEFKTPGFGVFGIGGLILLAIVFFGHHVAGLSGYEPMLLLLLGIVLIGVEVFLLPGTVVFALSGAVLILASLVWAMLDIWPDEPIEFDSDLLLRPLINLSSGVLGAAILCVLLMRFLPSGGPWGGMILQTAIGGEPGRIHALNDSEQKQESGGPTSLVGSKAVAATDLYPSGQVTVNGKRYEARLEFGTVDVGTELVVTEAASFGLVVKKTNSSKEAQS